MLEQAVRSKCSAATAPASHYTFIYKQTEKRISITTSSSESKLSILPLNNIWIYSQIRMSKQFLLLLLAVQIYKVSNLPSLKRSKEITTVIHTPIANSIPPTRKEKSANIPLSYQIHQHQILVPNLHVIPINNVQQYHEISHNNITHSVFPYLFPIHNLVPVHDLTVIPLHRVSEQKVSYRVHDEDNVYRNPLGGYGVGWQFGGHGAGHGFHYSYG